MRSLLPLVSLVALPAGSNHSSGADDEPKSRRPGVTVKLGQIPASNARSLPARSVSDFFFRERTSS